MPARAIDPTDSKQHRPAQRDRKAEIRDAGLRKKIVAVAHSVRVEESVDLTELSREERAKALFDRG